MTFIERIRLFIRSRRGVTAIEYGILAAGVAIVIGALVSSCSFVLPVYTRKRIGVALTFHVVF